MCMYQCMVPWTGEVMQMDVTKFGGSWLSYTGQYNKTNGMSMFVLFLFWGNKQAHQRFQNVQQVSLNLIGPTASPIAKTNSQ